MKKVLMVVGVLALALVGVLVFVVGKAKKELTPLVEQFLVDCRDGKVDEVYAKASEPFRKSVTLDDFRRFVAIRATVLGAFQAVASTSGGGMSTTTAGTTGNLDVKLTYERGTADAEFRFVKEDGAWRLLHVTIPFDEKLAPAPDRADLEPRSRALLDLYTKSSFAALYARFSKPLQEAWKVETYEPQVKGLREKSGAVVEAKLLDLKDEADGKVRLVLDVTFERGPGDATFRWVPALGEWHLVGFDLHLGPR